MKKHPTPDLQQAGTKTSKAELVTKLAMLAKTNREAYRELRDVMWRFVVENSARSDFPSEMS